ncbi:unnamed protein product [Mytilus coruscus]|uniref:Glycosyltransferase 61 catalytic domain-containing protein n=1 Tax=Mytilus coruscus TaxID=42192 RepID=A0A6J8E7X8_MYTCO|nr:unnamed protein product [Mytilus coruscus]
MEALVGLALFSDLERQNNLIHVTQKNLYVMQWLKLVKIDEKNVIDGTILADTLYVPEVGTCGSPSMEKIQWFRKTILPNVHRNIRNSVLLIKRTKSRVMPYFDKIQLLVENFAKQAKLDFNLHDDRSLPTLEIQLERFGNSSIVIGPHSAGMVNLIASQRETCVVEFTPIESNVCCMHEFKLFIRSKLFFHSVVYESNSQHVQSSTSIRVLPPYSPMIFCLFSYPCNQCLDYVGVTARLFVSLCLCH